MKKKKPDSFEDDGRVIAPMDVEGMPWHNPRPRTRPTGGGSSAQLNGRETRAALWGVLGAVLVIGLVFAGAFAAVILLLNHAWH